jgi:hypothetical protein
MHMGERFIRHGKLAVSAEGTHLVHADGTPFFYLGDTVWNGALLSSDSDWERYLDDRVEKGFSAIQFIAHAPWTAGPTDLEGREAFDEEGRPDEKFFKRMDRRMEAINARGLLAVPVLAWAANFGASARLNMGHMLAADELIPMLRYMVERLGRHHVMWVLAGDGVYNFWRARKWKKVGRAVFGQAKERSLVMMHPAGLTWPYARFADEDWLDVYGYQSSHSEDPRALRWLQRGPAAESWKKRARPTINLEPVYEGIGGSRGRAPFGREAVRRAVCWSLLNAPTAGVAYGAHGLWGWHYRAMEALNHTGLGVGERWDVAMNFPGSADVGRIGRVFRGIEWWKLRPDAELVLSPPESDPLRYVAAARSAAGDVAVIYLPDAMEILVDVSRIEAGLRGAWFSPATGEGVEATGAGGRFSPPGKGDWLLVFSK